MSAICDYLTREYGQISPQWLPQLDALALNYDLLDEAREAVANDGIMVTNRFGGTERHPLLKTIFDAQVQIQKITNQMGLSPSAKGKIKRDGAEDDALLLQRLMD